MTICRVKHNKNNPYLIINTTIAEDARISWKAKGLWFYAFSRRDDWTFYLSDLIKRSTDGEKSIYAGLKELEKSGYLVRNQKRKPDGKMGPLEWTFHETFQIILPHPQKGDAVKGDAENLPLTNKNSNPNNKKNNKDSVCDFALPKKNEKHEEPPPKYKNNDPDRFIKALNEDQKELHDYLVSFNPRCGEKLKSEDVCAWFLSRKFSADQVRMAFEVYRQDDAEALKRGRVVKSMGGVMVSAIKQERRPMMQDMEFNEYYAKNVAKRYGWMTVLKRYVKIDCGNLKEEVELNMPKGQFTSMIESMIIRAEVYC